MATSSIEMMEQYAPLIRTAEAIVSKSHGRLVRITSMERLTGPGGGSILYRCSALSEEQPAGSFIIKKSPVSLLSPENTDAWEVRGFFNDWAGAEFLSSLPVDTPIGPRFYGGDLDLGFFVLEDLGEHRSLVEPLLHGSATDAETGLLKYYTSLGTLHAMTAGKADQFEAMFSARFPGQPFAEESHELAERMQKVQKLLQQLGVKLDSRLFGEIDAVTKSVLQPGPFLAYIHSDPCPDNLFDQGDRYRFIDFEWGHFGHALLDAVYPRMLWPSCWCASRLPEVLITKLEDVYRAELIRGCPQAQEDAVWETALIHMCAMTMINRWGWDLELALNEDRKRGMATVRQRTLAQLEAFIHLSEKFQRLPVLCEVAGQIHTLFLMKWAETPDLPLYPAFEKMV